MALLFHWFLPTYGDSRGLSPAGMVCRCRAIGLRPCGI